MLRPRVGQRCHQPARMRGADRWISVQASKECSALPDEAAQDGVDDSGGARLGQHSGRIHREIHDESGSVTRILDLIGGGDQQSMDLPGQRSRRRAEQRIDGRLQPQGPAHRAERHGADRECWGLASEPASASSAERPRTTAATARAASARERAPGFATAPASSHSTEHHRWLERPWAPSEQRG